MGWRQSLAVLSGAAVSLAAPAAWAETLVPLEQGFTIAFAERDGVRRAHLVTAVDGDALEAVELGPGDAFAALDARSDEENLALARNGERVRLALAELLPLLEGAQQIAAGANYPEHGAEVDVDATFLFPKIATPAVSVHRLAVAPDWLLDYEVEIAVVFDRDIANEAELDAARAGVFVVNDFTERAQLVDEADLSQPGIGAGFAEAKGKPGFLPTGPFLVIPRDWRAFVAACEIRLFVNGAQRQRAHGSEMIWNVDEIVRRSLALAGQPHFVHSGRPVALVDAAIPRGMGILTGTPGGVVFKTPSGGFMAKGLAGWLGSFGFLDGGPVSFVKRSYVEDLRRQQVFLRPGDVVTAQGSGLGSIVTHVDAASAPAAPSAAESPR